MTAPGGEGFEIAEGHLTITVDDDLADRQILKFFKETDLKFAALEAAMAKHGDEGGERFGKGVRKEATEELDEFWRDTSGRLRDARGRFAREGSLAGKLFGGGFRRGTRDEIDRDGGGFFATIFKGIGSLGSIFGSAFSALTDFGSKIGDVGSKIGDFAGKIGNVVSALIGFAKVALIAMAIPAVLGLGGALADLIPLLLLLPGFIGGLLATILPLVVALHGMGDAISAMVSGDLPRFNEALKGLAPSAQKVLKEVQKLLPQIKGFGKAVQEAFFKPLVGAFGPLIKFLFPTLQKGFMQVAAALGGFVRQFVDLLASNDIIKDIGKLFASVGATITKMTPTIIKLISTLFGVMEHALPFIERIFDVIDSGLGSFTEWLSQAMKTGEFDKMLESAFETLKDLWGLVKAAGSLVGALFGDSGDEGRNFIQNITIAVQRLADFFRTAEGQKDLQTLLDTLKSIGVVVIAVGEAIAFTFKAFQFFADVLETVVRWVIIAWDWLKKFWGVITDGAGAVVDWLGKVGEFFGDLGSAIANFVSGAANAVVGWIESVVAFFQALPGRIKEAIMAIPGEISRIGQAAFDAFFRAIGYITVTVGQFVMSIPDKFRQLKDNVVARVMEMITAVGRWFSELPLKAEIFFSQLWSSVTSWVSRTVSSIGSWLSGLPGKIGGWFSDAWSRAKSATISGGNSVLDFVKSIPGKIGNALSGAGHWLYQTGRDMLFGLIDGIKSAVGAAIDAVKRAVNGIIEGAKRAVGAHSPSTKFRDEVGRWIPPGITEGIKEQMPALQRYLGSAMDQLVASAEGRTINVAAPRVSTGETNVAVMLDSEQIAARVATPPRVNRAATEGNRRRGWLDTGRPNATAGIS
jgi:phage-related protein